MGYQSIEHKKARTFTLVYNKVIEMRMPNKCFMFYSKILLCTHDLYVYMSVSLFVCTSVCLYVCMSVNLYVCLSVHLYVCMFACLYVCMPCCLYITVQCTRRIVSVDGAVKALCDRLSKRSETRTGKDLSEQCIKVKVGDL